MATYTKKLLSNPPRTTGSPYGDVVALPFNLTTNSSGVVANSDNTTALQAADIVRLGVLPAGTRLLDSITVVSDAFSATTTMDLGFTYVDGVDSTAVPQDADYFAAAVALSSTAIARKATVTAPVTLPKDAWLVLTNNTAAQAVVGVLDITIIGQLIGV